LTGHLQANSSDLAMSTVNYAEVLILMQDRQPGAYREIRDAIETSSIRLIPPTGRHAEIAAGARLRYPLNLGTASHTRSPRMKIALC